MMIVILLASVLSDLRHNGEGACREAWGMYPAARLRAPAMASFDAEQRMNEAFEQLKKEEGY